MVENEREIWHDESRCIQHYNQMQIHDAVKVNRCDAIVKQLIMDFEEKCAKIWQFKAEHMEIL